MSITSQLPPIALAQASANLRALAQAAGQTVEARVLSQPQNGMTQVQIGRQVVNLALPQAQPVGTTLTLSVQQSDGQLRLALVAVRPPDSAALPMPTAGAPPVPATSVQLSAAALSGQQPQVPQTSTSQPAQSPAAQPPTGGVAANAAAAPQPLATPGASRLPPAYGGPAAQASMAGSGGSIAGSSGMPASGGSIPQAAVGSSASGVVSAASATEALPLSSTAPAARMAAPPVPATAAVPAVGAASAGPPVALAGAAAAAPVSGGATGPVPSAPPGVSPNSGAAPSGGAIRADIPYAVAAPTQLASQPSAVPGSTATGLPPVGQMTSSTATGQHAPPNARVPVGVAQPAANAAPAAGSAPPAATPQAALAQMVQQALPRQDSILGLTTILTAIAGKVALPEPVAKAAQQVLAARLNLDAGMAGGAALKTAIRQSGVFQEALLGSGQGQAAAGDLKSSLLALRQGLGAWLGNQAPVAQVGTVPPPLRGQIPRARAGEGQPLDLPDDPLEIGKQLLERSEAALSRLRLLQNASLPDHNTVRQEAQWNMDLPVVVGGQQHVLHMQIQRDGEQDAERPEDRGWQVRFAINLAERGEAGAQISLRGKNTGVLIWADHPETAQSLALAVEDLRGDLASVGLVPGAIVVRAGAPAEQPSQPVGQAGHYVDARR